MGFIASYYPPLSERKPISPLYQPAIFALTLVPFFLAKRRLVATVIFPIIVASCFRAPSYTFGSPSANYYSSSPFIAMPIWFLEFAVLTPQNGIEAPVYVGTSRSQQQRLKRWEDLKGFWPRLSWAFSLMVPSHRGIGWNWQVKSIPRNPYECVNKSAFVRIHFAKALFAYVMSTAMLIILGIGSRLEERKYTESIVAHFVVNAIVGWPGAIWVWYRLCCFYSILAATTVGVGVCGNWQWPPLMGNLRDAWSVRQMWGVVYHQTMRKMVSQPGIRVTRMLDLRKGSIASRYLQLFVSFWFSCLVHQFQMFSVTRRDMGEFMFFMSQPIAILLEDFVQWLSQRDRDPKKDTKVYGKKKVSAIGYLWVFVWFSSSLPVYVKGCRDAGIIEDFIFHDSPYRFGAMLIDEYISRA